MRKLTSGLLLAGLGALPLAASANIVGLGASIGYWDSDLSGRVVNQGSSVDVKNDLNLSNNGRTDFSAYLEHPIPLLPNVRVNYLAIDQSGRGRLSADYDGIGAGVPVNSELKLKQLDITLYYKLLDNWVNLDLGLTARDLEGDLRVAADGQVSQTEIDGIIPMLYVAARFDLPLSGVSVGANGNALAFDGDSVYDFNVYGQYSFSGAYLRAGYRQLSVDYQDGDDRLDIELAGPFVSAGLTF